MPFSGNGLGSSVNKYQVSTPQHFIDFLNQEGGNTVDTYYEQVNDIDMNGVTVPRPATGSLHNYDGQGFKISNMSRVATASNSREALLSVWTDGGIWENIILENPYLEALDTSRQVRALVVGMNRGGLYRNVSIAGGELQSATGGTGTFVGQNYPNNDAGLPAGGIINCRSTATLTHTATTVIGDIGGFAGNMIFTSNPIDKCYYAGSVSIGAGNTSTAIGGFVGQSDRDVTNSFYDYEVGLNQAGAGPETKGTAKTTAEMQTLATYTNLATTGLDEVWDMVLATNWGSETWKIRENEDYPILGIESLPTLSQLIVRDGAPRSGVKVLWLEMEPFAADTISSGVFTNPTILGTSVSDAQGVASFTETFNDTKVHLAVEADSFYRTSDSTWLFNQPFGLENIDLTPPA